MKRAKLLPLAVYCLLAATSACSQAPSTPTLGPPEPGSQATLPDRGVAQADADEPSVDRERRDGRDGIRSPRPTFPRPTPPTTDDRRRRYRWPWWRYQGYYWPPYGGYGDRYSEATVITIRDYQFIPSTITVNVGALVTWVNRDAVPHTSTAPPPGVFSTQGAWDGVMAPGQSHSQSFNVPGRFEYYCRYHPFMRGAVIVRGRYY